MGKTQDKVAPSRHSQGLSLSVVIPCFGFVFLMGLALIGNAVETTTPEQKTVNTLLYVGIMVVLSLVTCTLAILRAILDQARGGEGQS